ncbi:hypothetical protein BS50DRAFT_670649 [Corynespora cassiicola Philippines]|uniref:Uncharacterized protein n=1 Tax=Corynespora cassiicola Philippines TaxID=1448308 RepID=A0A2T2PA17_CORCC|nr:hypothetical protein BS50DRAFT_670649 [Corynespora cassiicola Philippines]
MVLTEAQYQQAYDDLRRQVSSVAREAQAQDDIPAFIASHFEDSIRALSKLMLLPIFQNMHRVLPRELRDLIYQHVMADNMVRIPCDLPYAPSPRLSTAQALGFDGYYFLDPHFVGELAGETSQIFFQNFAFFEIDDCRQIPAMLPVSARTNTAFDLVAENLVRNLVIHILPNDDIGFLDECKAPYKDKILNPPPVEDYSFETWPINDYLSPLLRLGSSNGLRIDFVLALMGLERVVMQLLCIAPMTYSLKRNCIEVHLRGMPELYPDDHGKICLHDFSPLLEKEQAEFIRSVKLPYNIRSNANINKMSLSSTVDYPGKFIFDSSTTFSESSDGLSKLICRHSIRATEMTTHHGRAINLTWGNRVR